MALDLKTMASQGSAFWGKLPARKKLMLVGALAATVIALLVLTRKPEPRYSTLYAGLSPEDAGEVVAQLEGRGIPHRLEAGGTAVAVPADKVLDLRLDLAEQGMPRGGGVGFEVFDRQSFGTTSFVEQMNYRRALQGELARTITSLDAVDAARVHLALGERSLYKKDDEPPSASVVLRLRRRRELGPAQVKGIVHLVSSSVDGLAPERVTIVDERGDVLSSPEGVGEDSNDQRELERTLARRVQDLVERIVGPGHVAVTVTAEIDRSQVATTEEKFADQGVPRSEIRVEERTAGSAGSGGVAGARGNLPGAPDPAVGVGDPGVLRVEETRNFEVSKTIRSVTGPKVTIARLHVAIVVDAARGADGAPVARAAEELSRIEALARDAAGLDTERGDRITVHSTPFQIAEGDEAAAAPPTIGSPLPGNLPVWAPIAAGAALLLLGAAIAVARARRRRRQAAAVVPRSGGPLTLAEMEASLASGELGAAASPLALPARNARERALEAAREDAEMAARVVSLWLSEPIEEARP